MRDDVQLKDQLTSSAIYLDYFASTPVLDVVNQRMSDFAKNQYYNLSARYATDLKNYIESTKQEIMNLLNAKDGALLFGGGGTFMVNVALLGLICNANNRKKHIISSVIEHDAVYNTLQYLETLGYKVTYLPVDKDCKVDPNSIKEYLTADTALVSIMHVNNETGVIQPIEQITKIVKSYNQDIIVHSDGIAAVGKMSVDIGQLGVDSYTFSASKFYGPKSGGVSFVKNWLLEHMSSFVHGSKQEYGIIAGTENGSILVGVYEALKHSLADLQSRLNHEVELMEQLKEILLAKFSSDQLKINANVEILTEKIPSILHVAFNNLDRFALVDNFANAGLLVSTASASTMGLSRVVLALDIGSKWQHSYVRFSCGKFTTRDEIIQVGEIVQRVYGQMTK